MTSGMQAQLGMAAETTYGTAVTVTRFFPLVSENVTQDIERMESAGIIAGARFLRSNQWAPGRVMVTGDVQLELLQQNTALLFEHMLGSITSSWNAGTDVGTHTVTPGSLTGLGLTVQIGRPATEDSVIPFTYKGVKIASWEVALTEGEIATLGLTLIGQTETTETALASASFITDAAKPYHFLHGTMSISSSSVCVRAITLSGDNMLSDARRCIGQAFIDEPLEMALREYTGSMTVEFTNTTQYSYFVNGSEQSVVLTLSASASAQATFTTNVRYDGITPNVASRDLLVTDIPIKVVAPSTDASAITLSIKTAQSEL